MNEKEAIEREMSNELQNVLLYSKYFLEEYRSVLETTYKDTLDKAKSSNKVEEIFSLYSISGIVPYCFMYDYGTWLFFVTLSNPKCVVKYGDSKFGEEWVEKCLHEDREKEILKELNINKSDILNSVIIEGCKFLDKSENTESIERQARYHARHEVKDQVHSYREKDYIDDKRNMTKKQIELPSTITLRWLIEHVPFTFWLWLVGLIAGAFILGTQSTRISLVREILRIRTETERESTPKEEVKEVKTASNDSLAHFPEITLQIIHGLTIESAEKHLESIRADKKLRPLSVMEATKKLGELGEGIYGYLSAYHFNSVAKGSNQAPVSRYGKYRSSHFEFHTGRNNRLEFVVYMSEEMATKIDRLDGVSKKELVITPVPWEQATTMAILPAERLIYAESCEIQLDESNSITGLTVVIR